MPRQPFPQYMQAANDILEAVLGWSGDDIPAWQWWMAWHDRVPVNQAVKQAVKSARERA